MTAREEEELQDRIDHVVTKNAQARKALKDFVDAYESPKTLHLGDLYAAYKEACNVLGRYPKNF